MINIHIFPKNQTLCAAINAGNKNLSSLNIQVKASSSYRTVLLHFGNLQSFDSLEISAIRKFNSSLQLRITRELRLLKMKPA